MTEQLNNKTQTSHHSQKLPLTVYKTILNKDLLKLFAQDISGNEQYLNCTKNYFYNLPFLNRSYIWKFLVHVLLLLSLKYFEHHFASM